MEKNSRITDVIHTLDDPVGYVQGVVESFIEYQFDKATSVVRIGISGHGSFRITSSKHPVNRKPSRSSTASKLSVRCPSDTYSTAGNKRETPFVCCGFSFRRATLRRRTFIARPMKHF
jgi:hypothetical protein